jgi:hypothetical protein
MTSNTDLAHHALDRITRMTPNIYACPVAGLTSHRMQISQFWRGIA